MKNTAKLFWLLLTSYSITVAMEYEPSQLVGQVHPRALKAFLETQDDMKEMLTLYDLFWTRVKGGILSNDFVWYCRSINKSFTILFDKYFSDTDKWNGAKPLIIAKQNELMPDESIDDLIWVPTGVFDVRLVDEEKEFKYFLINSRPPHEFLEDIPPPSIIQVLESHPNMNELLTLYTIYWTYAEKENPEFEKFCQYLKAEGLI
ncbi:uncharacterized protein LOC126837210 [Adelges cooleyi]|uniref:uncharacterized protein LOC126837210 n=1 Tax=Adelges cooleyi TaxID=133065 RepID=UPI00217FF45A|nr:uncharacterized protein LOC126837210 [Adelges cooleyi]